MWQCGQEDMFEIIDILNNVQEWMAFDDGDPVYQILDHLTNKNDATVNILSI